MTKVERSMLSDNTELVELLGVVSKSGDRPSEWFKAAIKHMNPLLSDGTIEHMSQDPTKNPFFVGNESDQERSKQYFLRLSLKKAEQLKTEDRFWLHYYRIESENRKKQRLEARTSV